MSMKIEFAGIERTEALVAHAHHRLECLSRHSPRPLLVRLKLIVESHVQIVEGTLNGDASHLPGSPFHASAPAADMYAAIDGIADKLDKHLRRSVSKERDRRRRTPAPASAEA